MRKGIALTIGLLFLGGTSTALISCMETKKEGELRTNLDLQRIPEKIAVSFEGEPKIALIRKDGEKINIVEAKLPGPKGAEGYLHQIIFSPDGKYVFVTNTALDRISIFDGNTLSYIKDIPVGAHPTHLDVSQDGRFIATANEGSDTQPGSVSIIDIQKLEEIVRIEGFSVPHFTRNFKGSDGENLWFIANAGRNEITVIDFNVLQSKLDEISEVISYSEAENLGIIKDKLRVPGEPVECINPEEGVEEECGFFDVGMLRNKLLGAASHAKTGKFIIFNLKNLSIVKHGSIAKLMERLGMKADTGFLMAKIPVFSPFTNKMFIPFSKGVFIYNYVAGEDVALWRYNMSDGRYMSDTGSEIQTGVLVPMFDDRRVVLINERGELIKSVELSGHPQMVARYKDTVFITVAIPDEQGATTLAKVIGITSKGDVMEVANLKGTLIHGIHIPGVYARCH